MLGHSQVNPVLYFPSFGVDLGLFTLLVSLIKCFMKGLLFKCCFPVRDENLSSHFCFTTHAPNQNFVNLNGKNVFVFEIRIPIVVLVVQSEGR